MVKNVSKCSSDLDVTVIRVKPNEELITIFSVCNFISTWKQCYFTENSLNPNFYVVRCFTYIHMLPSMLHKFQHNILGEV